MRRSLIGLALSFSLSFLLMVPEVQAQVQTLRACEVESPPADCNEGNKWAVVVTVMVPHGAYVHVPDPGCMNDATGNIQKVLESAAAIAVPGLERYSGAITSLVAGAIDKEMRLQGGDIGRLFSPYAKNGALCAPIVAIVPIDAQVLGYRLLAADSIGGFRPCASGADCSIGWSKFQAEPVVQSNQAMQAVTNTFMNWSHDRSRKARMIIFYSMPPGQQPLTQM